MLILPPNEGGVDFRIRSPPLEEFILNILDGYEDICCSDGCYKHLSPHKVATINLDLPYQTSITGLVYQDPTE